MQLDPHKTRSTLPRLQKRCLSVEKGAAGISGQMLFPVELRCLFQRHVHAALCPYVWGGGSLLTAPIHTCQASIWALMSPKHVSAGWLTERRRSSVYLQLTCVTSGCLQNRLSRVLCYICRVEFHNSWEGKTNPPVLWLAREATAALRCILIDK